MSSWCYKTVEHKRRDKGQYEGVETPRKTPYFDRGGLAMTALIIIPMVVTFVAVAIWTAYNLYSAFKTFSNGMKEAWSR